MTSKGFAVNAVASVAAAVVVLALSGAGPLGAARAATWTVDPAHSRLGFSGSQAGAAFTGRFKSWTATIDFDPAKPEAAHVVVSIDVASATTDDTQRDEALPQADWFDAATHPRASFEASGFTPKGGPAFVTNGTLTLRGIAKSVILPFDLTVAGGKAHATGKIQLIRTDFGVGQGSWSDGSMVALDVGVDFDLSAESK